MSRGDGVPRLPESERKTRQIVVCLRPIDYQAFKEEAALDLIGMSARARQLIVAFLAERRPKPTKITQGASEGAPAPTPAEAEVDPLTLLRETMRPYGLSAQTQERILQHFREQMAEIGRK